MKKQYMHPEMKEIKIQSQQIMAGSPILGGEYGGGNVLGKVGKRSFSQLNLHNSVEDTFYTKSLQSQEKKLSLHNKTQKDSMNGDHTERLSQEGECRENGESCILESASAFSQRVLEEIEAIAGTTTCKAVQLVRLKKWAQEQGYRFCDHSQFGDFIDRGSENEVYLSPNSREIPQSFAKGKQIIWRSKS